MNMAFLEERGGAAKDEIDMPADVTSLEILAAPVYEERVLPAKEAAVAKHRTVAVDAYRQRLPFGTGRILERDVLRRKVVGIDYSRRGSERRDRLAVKSDQPSVKIERQYRLSGVFATQTKETL